MGRLIVRSFVTVDGVQEAPGFEEHRSGRNAWALRHMDEELQRYSQDQADGADAVLVGRTTYLIWAAFWPTVPADDRLASRMNEIPKFVVSRTLASADWANTTILRGDLATEIGALKERFAGEVLIYGNADLIAELIHLGLIDEYRLLLFPVILGSGKRLFRDEAALNHLHLVSTRSFNTGVVLLTYEPSLEAPSGRFANTYAWTDEQVDSLEAARNTERVLATVMFTDIVDSTGRAAALGDRPWRQLLDRHDELAAAEVARWHGRLVNSTGDGILAAFDAPTRAIRCGFALRSAVAAIGLDIRVAVHTGEVEVRGDDVGGIGIHIASRALAEAGDRAVVVTQTVRDLATGTDLSFVSLGTAGLRGVPGRWELFEASTAKRAFTDP